MHDTGKVRCWSNDAIASACLYLSCRQDGVPCTFKEICTVSLINKKEIGRYFKAIINVIETSVELITTGDFVQILVRLPWCVQRAVTQIARRAVDMDIVHGRSPISVAAAAIYMASQVNYNNINVNAVIITILFL